MLCALLSQSRILCRLFFFIILHVPCAWFRWLLSACKLLFIIDSIEWKRLFIVDISLGIQICSSLLLIDSWLPHTHAFQYTLGSLQVRIVSRAHCTSPHWVAGSKRIVGYIASLTSGEVNSVQFKHGKCTSPLCFRKQVTLIKPSNTLHEVVGVWWNVRSCPPDWTHTCSIPARFFTSLWLTQYIRVEPTRLKKSAVHIMDNLNTSWEPQIHQ